MIDPNDSAFPLNKVHEHEDFQGSYYGLTKLQYAAIEICKGLSANPVTQSEGYTAVAQMAVEQAKALFEALDNE